jgi:anti-anti-sigma factor
MLQDKNAHIPEVPPLALPEIVTFPDEIDISNAASVGAELFGACRPGFPVVIADLSQTKFCDSRGIYCLLAAHDQATICGVELRIVVESAAVLRAMTVLGVDQLLSIYPTMDEALSGRNAADQVRPTAESLSSSPELPGA